MVQWYLVLGELQSDIDDHELLFEDNIDTWK